MTATAPRAVIFDFGGVVWNMRWDVCRALEAEHGLPRGSVFSTLYRSAEWEEVERGRGMPEDWLVAAHAALERAAGRSLPPLHERWRAAQALIAENLALIRALRPPYRLSLLSNADLTLRARLAEHPGVVELFDDIVCSAEVGFAKPDPQIYALALDRLGVPAAACVFVDDSEANVQAAEGAGLRGVLYRVDRGDDLRALLAAAGVAVGAS